MLFDSDDLDYSFLNLAGLTNNKSYNNNNMYDLDNNKIVSSKEGLLRGNMFDNEYVPYKNLTYITIYPKSEREAKLFTVMQYSFAINDLNLYLDVHPEDKDILYKLEEFIKEEKKAKQEYVDNFGPLDICDTDGNEFKWINSPWSWEKDRGEKYV